MATSDQQFKFMVEYINNHSLGSTIRRMDVITACVTNNKFFSDDTFDKFKRMFLCIGYLENGISPGEYKLVKHIETPTTRKIILNKYKHCKFKKS